MYLCNSLGVQYMYVRLFNVFNRTMSLSFFSSVYFLFWLHFDTFYCPFRSVDMLWSCELVILCIFFSSGVVWFLIIVSISIVFAFSFKFLDIFRTLFKSLSAIFLISVISGYLSIDWPFSLLWVAPSHWNCVVRCRALWMLPVDYLDFVFIYQQLMSFVLAGG